MRRLVAITLLLFFGLPLMSPLFAQGQSPDAKLPICCRRGGQHQCMMSAAELAALEGGRHLTTLHAKCPMFPQAVAAVHHEVVSLYPSAAFYAELAAHPAVFPQVEAWARVALAGARQKRGPPAVRLS